jgi:hypothetical protein
MNRAEVLSYSPRASRRHPVACSCGLIQLGYLPERRVGSVVHGALCCVRNEPEPDHCGHPCVGDSLCPTCEWHAKIDAQERAEDAALDRRDR